MSKQQEIEQIIHETFQDTGVRLFPDDPIVAVLLSQKRALLNFLEANKTQQEKIQELFLNEFTTSSEDVLAAAKQIQEQKQQIIAEILHANATEFEESEEKLQYSIIDQLQHQHKQDLKKMQNDYLTIMNKRFTIFMMLNVINLCILVFLLFK